MNENIEDYRFGNECLCQTAATETEGGLLLIVMQVGPRYRITELQKKRLKICMESRICVGRVTDCSRSQSTKRK